jgi:hypothetical protein
VSGFKGTKLSAMPLALSTLKVNPLANNGVTKLMVEHGCYPSTRGWLKELLRHYDPSAPDIAGSENPLLRAATPRDDVGIELGTIGIVLRSQVRP